MFCGQCGKKVPDTARHCPYCGAVQQPKITAPVQNEQGTGTQEGQAGRVEFQNTQAGRYQGMPAQNTQTAGYQGMPAQNIQAPGYQGMPAQNTQASGYQGMPNQNRTWAQNTHVGNQAPYAQGWQQPPMMQQPAGKTRRKKKGHKGLAIALVVIIALGGVGSAGGYKYYQHMQETNYKAAMSKAQKAMDEKDYEQAAGIYKEALKIKSGDAKAKAGLDNADAMGMISTATSKLKNLTSYDADITYEMKLHIKDSSAGKEYALTQVSDMTATNISEDESGSRAHITGDLITETDGDDESTDQSFEMYLTSNGGVRTDYSYTEGTGWGAAVATGASDEGSLLLGNLADYDYQLDTEATGDQYVYTATRVKAAKNGFLTRFCSISSVAASARSQYMNVSLHLNKKSGSISEIVYSFPDLVMTDVNSYYNNYSGKSLSIALENLSYTVKVTDWDSSTDVSVPQEALDSASIGAGISTAVGFSTEPIAYLGSETEEASFRNVDYEVPVNWIKMDIGDTERDYYLNTSGSANITMGFIDESDIGYGSDEENIEAIANGFSRGDGTIVSDQADVVVDDQDSYRFNVTQTVESQTASGVIYIIPTGDAYMVIMYVLYGSVDNIWQGQFNNFIDSIQIA